MILMFVILDKDISLCLCDFLSENYLRNKITISFQIILHFVEWQNYYWTVNWEGNIRGRSWHYEKAVSVGFYSDRGEQLTTSPTPSSLREEVWVRDLPHTKPKFSQPACGFRLDTRIYLHSKFTAEGIIMWIFALKDWK